MELDQEQNHPAYVKVNERGVPAIEKVQYLKKKGLPAVIENIFPWSPSLAERIAEFEPLKGAPPKVDLSNRRSDEEEAAKSPRMAMLLEAMEMLDPEKDYTELGQPKIESLRKLVDENVTLDERNTAFALYGSRKKNKKK